MMEPSHDSTYFAYNKNCNRYMPKQSGPTNQRAKKATVHVHFIWNGANGDKWGPRACISPNAFRKATILSRFPAAKR